MPIIDFPSVKTANKSGLVAVGGDLSVESILLAYSRGIYPWPIDQDFPLAWFSPDPRGVIEVEAFIIQKSLKKFLRKCDYKVSFNNNFLNIISQCQKAHSLQNEGTWITDEIIKGYTDFFKAGYAYCIEVRSKENELIGGLYGVKIGEFISGESMFHLESNASKVALAVLLYNLKNFKIKYFDTQMVTETTKKFGAKNIKRDKFIKYLNGLSPVKQLNFEAFETNLSSIKW